MRGRLPSACIGIGLDECLLRKLHLPFHWNSFRTEEPIANAEHTFTGIGEGKIGEICKTGSWRKTRRDEVQVVQALLDWGTKSKGQKGR